MAAIFPSHSRNLRSGSAAGCLAFKAHSSDCGCVDYCMGIASLVFQTAGTYAFPLTWILIGLAAVWLCLEFLPRSSDLVRGLQRRSHFARCSPRTFASRQIAEFPDTIFLKNCLVRHRSIRSGFT